MSRDSMRDDNFRNCFLMHSSFLDIQECIYPCIFFMALNVQNIINIEIKKNLKRFLKQKLELLFWNQDLWWRFQKKIIKDGVVLLNF